jgi:hypothetical protein
VLLGLVAVVEVPLAAREVWAVRVVVVQEAHLTQIQADLLIQVVVAVVVVILGLVPLVALVS